MIVSVQIFCIYIFQTLLVLKQFNKVTHLLYENKQNLGIIMVSARFIILQTCPISFRHKKGEMDWQYE